MILPGLLARVFNESGSRSFAGSVLLGRVPADALESGKPQGVLQGDEGHSHHLERIGKARDSSWRKRENITSRSTGLLVVAYTCVVQMLLWYNAVPVG